MTERVNIATLNATMAEGIRRFPETVTPSSGIKRTFGTKIAVRTAIGTNLIASFIQRGSSRGATSESITNRVANVIIPQKIMTPQII